MTGDEEREHIAPLRGPGRATPVMTPQHTADRPARQELARQRPIFHNLDALRGLCALLVALFHAVWTSHLHNMPVVLNGWLFVDFFFVLSGFVIAHTYWDRIRDWKSVGSFVVRRFFRLYPIHITTFLACYVAIAVGQHFEHARATSATTLLWTPEALQTILLVQGLGFSRPSFNLPSWSISAEFWTYMVFAAELMIVSATLARIILVSIVGVAAFAFIYVLNYPHGLFTALEFGFPRCIAGFALGAMVNLLWRTVIYQPSSTTVTIFLAILFVACWFVLLFVTVDNPWNCMVLPLFAAIVFVCASDTSSFFKTCLEMPFMRALGRVSYSMYMVHSTVLIAVSFAISRFAPQLKSGQVAGAPQASLLLGDGFCVLYLAVIIAVSLGAYRLIEDPFRHLGNRLSKKLFPSSRAAHPDQAARAA